MMPKTLLPLAHQHPESAAETHKLSLLTFWVLHHPFTTQLSDSHVPQLHMAQARRRFPQPKRPPLQVNLGRHLSCFLYTCLVTTERPPTATTETTSRTSAACSIYVSSMLAAQKQLVCSAPRTVSQADPVTSHWAQAPPSISVTSPRQPHTFTRSQRPFGIASEIARAQTCTQEGCMRSPQGWMTDKHDVHNRICLRPEFGSPHAMLRRTPSAARDACADCCPERRSLRAIEVSLMKLYFSVTCNRLPVHSGHS